MFMGKRKYLIVKHFLPLFKRHPPYETRKDERQEEGEQQLMLLSAIPRPLVLGESINSVNICWECRVSKYSNGKAFRFEMFISTIEFFFFRA